MDDADASLGGESDAFWAAARAAAADALVMEFVRATMPCAAVAAVARVATACIGDPAACMGDPVTDSGVLRKELRLLVLMGGGAPGGGVSPQAPAPEPSDGGLGQSATGPARCPDGGVGAGGGGEGAVGVEGEMVACASRCCPCMLLVL